MAKGTASLTASTKAIDPTLDALFSSSAGPVRPPPTSRYSALLEKKPRPAPEPTNADAEEEEGDDEELSEISEELDYEDSEEIDRDEESSEDKDDEADENSESASEDEDADVPVAEAPTELDTVVKTSEADQPNRERKRKRKDDNEDLEDKYLSRLADEEEASRPAEKRRKEDDADEKEDDDDEVPVHESLTKDANASELEKAARTVFLANVSVEAINSKAAKRTLMAHLSSTLDTETSPPEKIESIRFRSVAFSGASMPKRAAFITKALMQETTKSANAYVVYSTQSAARNAAAKLNGTEVLGRHIRVDSVAHPSPVEHRRCVFVGNLGFVDDETVLNTNADGETKQKKRNKIPADVEEGLWRTFSTQGKVENVRVIRDPLTRIGKGFAYVQFYDANAVESALLLDGKKFPPMLPRPLRVTRAKDPRKTALAQDRAKAKALQTNGAAKSTKYQPKATPEEQSMAGRTQKLLGRSAAVQQRYGKKKPHKNGEPDQVAVPEFKTPEQVVFEGRRASAKDGVPKDLKKISKKLKARSGKPQNRSARRAAEWKKKNQ